MNTESKSQVSLFPDGENLRLLKAIYDDIVFQMNTYQKLIQLLPSIQSAETKDVIRGQMSQCFCNVISILQILSLDDIAVLRSYAEDTRNTAPPKIIVRTSTKICVK